MPQLIGLDLGTTTITGVLLDTGRGEVLRLAQQRNDAALRASLAGRAEQDAGRMRMLALKVLAELADGGLRVDGLALTGQKHGLLCVDARNQALTPLISWQDQRTAEPQAGGATTLDQIQARLAGLDWLHNGCRIHHGYGAATLFWLEQQGELPPGTHRVCTIAGWLAGQLANQLPNTDPTFAASWGIYDLVERTWNPAFLDRLGLDVRLLPPIRHSGARTGRLAPEAAQATGLPAGLPVYNAVGDTQAAFLGAAFAWRRSQHGANEGVKAAGEGQYEVPILLNLGTGGQICWMVPHFEVPSETVETRPLPGGRFLRVGASLCGGAAYAWLNQTVRGWLADFGLELDEETIYERLNALAAEAEGTAGLRVQTTFLGVRGEPAIQAGAIEGIRPDNLALGALARATLTGLVDELRDLYLAHREGETGQGLVIATGGAVRKTPLLAGLIECQFGHPVWVPPLRETAAVGAAGLRKSRLRPRSQPEC